MEAPGQSVEITLPVFECLRCTHHWHPKKPEKPVCCAFCKSPYWDKQPEKPVGAKKRHDRECKTCVPRN